MALSAPLVPAGVGVVFCDAAALLKVRRDVAKPLEESGVVEV